MKKRVVGILVGVMVSSMLLSACTSNEAKEAASESAQVEEEGTGARTEEGEKVETAEPTEAEKKVPKTVMRKTAIPKTAQKISRKHRRQRITARMPRQQHRQGK